MSLYKQFSKYFLLLSLFVPSHVFAGEFHCSINSVLELGNTGTIVTHGWSANYQNRKFTVDRETGRVINTTALKVRLSNYDKDSLPLVFDNEENNGNYRAVTLYEETGKYAVLEIRNANDLTGMPFIYHTNIGMILTGKCRDGKS